MSDTPLQDPGRDVLADAIERMTEALTEQVQETSRGNQLTQSLVDVTTERTKQVIKFNHDQAERDKKQNRRQSWRDLFIAAALVILLANAYQGAQTRGRLISCTEPTGKCFKANERRSAPVVKDLADRLQRIEEAVDAIESQVSIDNG